MKKEISEKLFGIQKEEQMLHVNSSQIYEVHINNKTTVETPTSTILGLKRCSKVDLYCHFFPCMKVFKSRENLDLHILNIHLKIKPFSCEFCEKKFSHRNGKNYHERTRHLNDLPFNCMYEGCYKRYASKSALSFHQQSKHFE